MANGNPNPCTDLDEIFHAHPHLSREGFGPGSIPAPSPPEPQGLETLKAEGHIFKMLSRLQINTGSARVPQLVYMYKTLTSVQSCEGAEEYVVQRGLPETVELFRGLISILFKSILHKKYEEVQKDAT